MSRFSNGFDNVAKVDLTERGLEDMMASIKALMQPQARVFAVKPTRMIVKRNADLNEQELKIRRLAIKAYERHLEAGGEPIVMSDGRPISALWGDE